VVVTSNHDMILLCVDQNEPVVWIDPRSRALRYPEMVLLVFGQVEDWDEMLGATTGPVCIRAQRTRCEAIELNRAAHLVTKRMREIAARERTRRRASPPGDRLFGDEDLGPAPQE
jgi:hypothetical protein